MVEFNGYWFLEIHRLLDVVSQRGAQKDVLSQEKKEQAMKVFDEMIRQCTDVGLRVTSISLIEMQTTLQQPTIDWDEFHRLASEARDRMRDEMLLTTLLHVPSDRAPYYHEVPQFGPDVASKFPKVVEDVQEAAKSFALGRYTATVFHLMRVMEVATQELGNRLGINLVAEKNWHNILDEVDKAVKKLPVSNGEEKANRNKFAESSVHLRMVKDAWRNDVMHPKSTYTGEEAERVFRNVRDFMVHLAVKL